MSNSIKEQLAAAIGARKDSLKALRARIIDLLEDVPVGVKLSDEKGEFCRIAKVKDFGCVPGGGSRRNYTEWAVIADGKLVATAKPDNFSEYYFPGDDLLEGQLKWLRGKDTRAIALRLPEAIARYIAECEAEAAANESTAVVA